MDDEDESQSLKMKIKVADDQVLPGLNGFDPAGHMKLQKELLLYGCIIPNILSVLPYHQSKVTFEIY